MEAKNWNVLLPGSNFADRIFTEKLSGVDSAGVLRQGALFC